MCLFNYSLQLESLGFVHYVTLDKWLDNHKLLVYNHRCIPLVNIGVIKIVSSTLHSQAAWPYAVGIAVSATMPSITTSELVRSGNPQLCSTQIGSSNSIAPTNSTRLYVVGDWLGREQAIPYCDSLFLKARSPNLLTITSLI